MELKWRVNVFALIGACIGIIAIFLYWRTVFAFMEMNLPELLTDGIGGISTGMYVVAILCVISAFVALITPIVGILESIGAIIFLIDNFSIDSRIWDNSGPILFLISGIICILSIVKPKGFGYHGTDHNLKTRLFTFSKFS